MKNSFALTLAMALILGGTACRRNGTAEVRVTVLVDSDSEVSKLLQRKFLNFGAEEHRVSSGKRVALLQMYLPASRFQNYVASEMNTKYLMPDLVVLDAPEQANLSPIAKQGAVNAKNACGVQANCPVFITPWTSGEKLEAAKVVLNSLTRNE